MLSFWIPKRRKPVLKGDIKLRLATILESVATEREWIIKAKEIAPDHVHLLVEYNEQTPICEVYPGILFSSFNIIFD
jgi:putative transposase